MQVSNIIILAGLMVGFGGFSVLMGTSIRNFDIRSNFVATGASFVILGMIGIILIGFYNLKLLP
jgi:hypothetical protein